MAANNSSICKRTDGLKPTILMVLVQLMFSGINILYKLAAEAGMDLRIMVAYRFLFGASFILPYAFFIERGKRPKLTRMVIFQAFLSGLFGGALGQNLYLESLNLTSATFAAAMTNLIPAVTFVIAVFGTIIGIIGAMVFTFYKGPEIVPWKTNLNLLDLVETHHHQKTTATTHDHHNLVLGVILALLSCACYSCWLIIQAKAVAAYPCPQSFTALTVLMAAIQSPIFALCVQRDWSQWRMGWDIKLVTVAYAGIVGSGIMFGLVAICIRMRGPLFVSVFNPLLLIIVAIIGSLVLDEKLHLGSVVGAILIIGGLYAVLWGKSKEIKKMNQLVPADKNSGVEEDENIQDQTGQVEISIDPKKENDDNTNNSTNKVMDEER
ncbi:hypothetical protein M9H77_20789 [Catharanthus roseus]|uniref:Uncharacterized protein n=1 Tax=Catharanthus roseus TaxID=4058 RepID=A0ACC0AL66_CATRO|nr:hypothetical protein M9H77_20789 [Catharanthus roseus]